MLPVIDSSGRMTGRQILFYAAALIPITLVARDARDLRAPLFCFAP